MYANLSKLLAWLQLVSSSIAFYSFCVHMALYTVTGLPSSAGLSSFLTEAPTDDGLTHPYEIRVYLNLNLNNCLGAFPFAHGLSTYLHL